jgi:flagellar motor switch protein FliM
MMDYAMTAGNSPDPHALLRLGLAGERAKRAEERLKAEQKQLEGAIRRTLPYLVRRKISVMAHEVRCVLLDEVIDNVARPFHVTPIRAGERAVGALVLDGPAIAHCLDGVLGAGRNEPTALDASGLSPAQSALALRLARGLVASFGEALARIGVTLEPPPESNASLAATARALPPASQNSDPSGLLVACTIRIGDGDNAGHITLMVPAAGLDKGPSGQAPRTEPEPKTVAALANVELDVVVELGRVKLPLARLATMKVGDVLRLPLPVDAKANLRVGERALFRGRPTTRGAQIAVEIARHGD